MAEIVLPKLEVTAQTPLAAGAGPPLIEISNLSLSYGKARALKEISLNIRERIVTAFIGPSGCGKSTLLRCLNRMNDLIDGVRIEGTFEGQIALRGMLVVGESGRVTCENIRASTVIVAGAVRGRAKCPTNWPRPASAALMKAR